MLAIVCNLNSNPKEEPGNLRATTGTIEDSRSSGKEMMITALSLGARPIQQHEPAARHNIRTHDLIFLATSYFKIFVRQLSSSYLARYNV